MRPSNSIRAGSIAFALALGMCATAVPVFATTPYPSRTDAVESPRSVVVAEQGTFSDQFRIGAPTPDTTYDLRGYTNVAYPDPWTYPLSFGKDVPGLHTVVLGGTVDGTAPETMTWQELKTYDGTALLMFGQDYLVSYDLRADDVFDMFRPRPPAGDVNATYLIDGCRGTTIRDDAVEVDHEMTGTIDHCVLDGINSGVSIGQNETNPHAVTTIENSIFIFRAMPNTNAIDGMGHAVLFKQLGAGQVVMHNVVVCYPETPIAPIRLTNWMPGRYDHVSVVLGAAFDGDADGDVTDLDYPGTLPAGVTQTRDWSLCDASAPPPPIPPTIDAFSPSSGAAGTAVTLSGGGFTDATDVRFGGVSAQFSVTDDGHITTWVPIGAITGRISVASPGAATASGSDFTVLVPPSISSFSPTSAPVGATVTITGSSFTGVTDVRFNGTSAPFAVVDSSHISATVPTGATSGPIAVVTSGGSAQSAMSFVVKVPVTLTFGAAADTYIASAYPKRNFGTSPFVRLNHKPTRDVLIKFVVSGIGSRVVQSAQLRLYCVDASASGGTFYAASSNSWAESTVTWETAPKAGSTAVATLGAVVIDTWYQVDLTSLVTRDGTYSLRVKSPSTNEAQYVTKEGSATFAPQLVVTAL